MSTSEPKPDTGRRLDLGHLWSHREITVPIGATSAVRTDEVQLDLTADELTALPTVRYHPRR